MSETSQLPGDDSSATTCCPACGAALPPAAVLCVGCGFHLQHGRHLATVVDRGALSAPKTATDGNPYASPADLDRDTFSHAHESYKTDLTEAGASQAKAIVGDANMLVWAVLMSLFCPVVGVFVWILMLPWYAYRTWQWCQLDRACTELHEPNSFSPHGALAGAFQDCKPRLWAGMAIGFVFWAILACGGVLSVFVEQ